ncbi:thiamine pyrophosphate-requiring protein [Alicyclobacillus dauci]|uniref:Thiamine pyrophosphate-requiring protein n=1 Tax=Alicyclobacillus dauci TaxID=1475485 RepID=A0ABY6YYL3_9BACL|nr:thiamine pyrophosphate-requiring protein [Alicyclobacillus dauci]WAH35715.1 thiamine pyrophosphate-requiring protein [Alicyclobacillus dauci]
MQQKYTTGTAFLEALRDAGVSYLFVNLGSDHPALIESLAQVNQEQNKFPQVITCPHEMVALSAAHGYAQVTGRPQAVIVHVECGTQNLGGAIHNAAKGRVPVLVFAGASPYTQENELLGSRNEFIHWIQDVRDQRGIVRGYVKYDNEIRTGANVKQLVYRSLQIAQSNPKGPVYLMGPREVMEEETEPVTLNSDLWQPISPSALPSQGVRDIVSDLLKAENPLIVTSYLGRSNGAVEELTRLCNRLAIPVVESVPSYMNFPTDNPLHCGYQWTNAQNELLSEADVVLVIDSDVPWIPSGNKPSEESTVYYIDVDPLKTQMPLWYIPSKRFFAADSGVALQQLNEYLDFLDDADVPARGERRERIARVHERQRSQWTEEETGREHEITPAYLTACVRELLDDNTIVLSEGISNFDTICRHLRLTKPGTLLSSGGGSLGWHGGAAIGVKLAMPYKTIISLVGDGTYMFSVPSSVHWIARKYQTPFLTVIYNNGGWKSPKLSTLAVHPEGVAKRTDTFFTKFDPGSDLEKIAEAAGGAFAKSVEDPRQLKDVLREALAEVQNGHPAVVNVRLPHH